MSDIQPSDPNGLIALIVSAIVAAVAALGKLKKRTDESDMATAVKRELDPIKDRITVLEGDREHNSDQLSEIKSDFKVLKAMLNEHKEGFGKLADQIDRSFEKHEERQSKKSDEIKQDFKDLRTEMDLKISSKQDKK